MGWIIGIVLILVLAACISVGWESLLIVGAVGGVLYTLHRFSKKAEEAGATEHDKTVAETLLKIVSVIAVCLIIVGGFLGLMGLAMPQQNGYKSETCGWCGGTGILTSGKKCNVCNGAGGAVFEKHDFLDITWLGILMAASGAILFIAKPVKKLEPASDEYTTDSRTTCLETPAATFYISYGHWSTGLTKKTWVFNKPNTEGFYTVRCDMKFHATKEARKVVLYIQPRNTYGNPQSEDILMYEDFFTEDYINSVVWQKYWQHQDISGLRINKTTIYFKDDTRQSIVH